MQRYILERILLAIPTLILISLLVFVGLRVAIPYDVVDKMLSSYDAAGFAEDDPELRAQLEEELGLTGSIPAQYARWVGLAWFWGGDTGILQGDFGRSLKTNRPVLEEIKNRVPVSFELGVWAQFTAIIVSVPLGVWAAVAQDKAPDYGLRSIAILLNAVPSFWLAVLALVFGSLWFGWTPPLEYHYFWEDPLSHLKIVLIPAIIIGLTPSGGLLRLVRTQMLEVMRQDYVRTARSKGLGESSIMYKHALRNALLPIVTVIGVGLPNVIAGTVIFEQIFLLPGMGRYLVDAVNALDYPVIQGLNLIFAMLLLMSVIVVDVSYALLDPRIRLK
jgi:peptide/nickel transport system permease protein